MLYTLAMVCVDPLPFPAGITYSREMSRLLCIWLWAMLMRPLIDPGLPSLLMRLIGTLHKGNQLSQDNSQADPNFG